MTDREKQIMTIAEIMFNGELAREQGKIDCSMFNWKDCLNLGIQRLAGATALYNAGYRKADEVRKETAKEMLQELDSRLWDGIDTNADIGGAEHNQTIRSLMKFIKSKYGVTVDNNATH